MQLHVPDSFEFKDFSGKHKGVAGHQLLGEVLFHFTNNFALIAPADALHLQPSGFHYGADILPVTLNNPFGCRAVRAVLPFFHPLVTLVCPQRITAINSELPQLHEIGVIDTLIRCGIQYLPVNILRVCGVTAGAV